MSDELENFFSSLPERAAARDLSGVNAVYVFAVEGGGAWTVRIADGKVTVSPGGEPGADCTISASEETFSRLVSGELGAVPAYLGGRLRLSGDLGVAMQLQKLL